MKRGVFINPEDERIRFEAFRRWIGSSIEKTEGYYFRHDSAENPNFKQLALDFNSGNNSPQKVINIHPLLKSASYSHLKKGREDQVSDHTDILRDLIAKINTKYQHISKAFMEMNFFKDPEGISFKSFCRFLIEMQFFLSSGQMKDLFNRMDADHSGYIG